MIAELLLALWGIIAAGSLYTLKILWYEIHKYDPRFQSDLRYRGHLRKLRLIHHRAIWQRVLNWYYARALVHADRVTAYFTEFPTS